MAVPGTGGQWVAARITYSLTQVPTGTTVITSYSIHYTKLYDSDNAIAAISPLGPGFQSVAVPSDFLIAAVFFLFAPPIELNTPPMYTSESLFAIELTQKGVPLFHGFQSIV